MSVYIKTRLHILDIRGELLCRKPRTSGSIKFDKVPTDSKICSECLKEVGRLMIGDYVGLDNISNKTLRTLLKEARGGGEEKKK